MITNEQRLIAALKDSNVVLILVINCLQNKNLLRLLQNQLSHNVDLITEIGT